MDALPEPDDGWRHLFGQLIAVAVLWAITTFGLAAVALPLMDLQCQSDSPTGGQACPLEPDPALTHLFDVRWPEIPGAVGVPVIVVSMLIGIGVALFVDTSEPWSQSGGAPTVAGAIAGLFGAGVGLFLAGPGFVDPLVAVGITGLGALLVALARLGVWGFQRALRRSHARHLRREHLLAHGTRTVATISALEWLHRYGGKEGEDPVFEVTARLGPEPQARTTTEWLTVPREDSPIVGGTVLVIHDDLEDHPTGIDVLVELDPNGLSDPDALERYPAAPPPS